VSFSLNTSPPFWDSKLRPLDPISISTPIVVSADFADPGVIDTHLATWSWGDGITSPGMVVETGGEGVVEGEHRYDESGIYSILLTIADQDGASGTALFQYIVIYNPEGEFVTVGGWIDSSAGV